MEEKAERVQQGRKAHARHAPNRTERHFLILSHRKQDKLLQCFVSTLFLNHSGSTGTAGTRVQPHHVGLAALGWSQLESLVVLRTVSIKNKHLIAFTET